MSCVGLGPNHKAQACFAVGAGTGQKNRQVKPVSYLATQANGFPKSSRTWNFSSAIVACSWQVLSALAVSSQSFQV